VIAVTASRTGTTLTTVQYQVQREEVRMVALAKQTKSRLVRWFQEITERNKPPYKWYEHDHYGI
jgi:hypothetical protein